MTYQEIAKHLLRVGSSLGRAARIVEDTNVTGLYIEPVGWIVAIQDTGELDLVRYRAEDLRLVKAQSIPFAKVTQKMLGDQLDLMLIELVGRVIERSVQPHSGSLPGEPVEEHIHRRISLQCQMAA